MPQSNAEGQSGHSTQMRSLKDRSVCSPQALYMFQTRGILGFHLSTGEDREQSEWILAWRVDFDFFSAKEDIAILKY